MNNQFTAKALLYLFSGALVCALSSACSTAITPQNAASANVRSYGVVVASVEQFSNHDYTKQNIKNMMLEFYVRSSNLVSYEPFHSMNGQLKVFMLRPGAYSISDWWVSYFIADRRFRTDNKFEFIVEPGTVTYIGAFETEVWLERGTPHAVPTMRDKRDRDMSQFAEEYPALASLPKQYAVIDGFSW